MSAPTSLLQYLFVFSDGGALAVSNNGQYVMWVENDWDPWVLADKVEWQDVSGTVRFTVTAVCMSVDAALHERDATCEHDLRT